MRTRHVLFSLHRWQAGNSGMTRLIFHNWIRHLSSASILIRDALPDIVLRFSVIRLIKPLLRRKPDWLRLCILTSSYYPWWCTYVSGVQSKCRPIKKSKASKLLLQLGCSNLMPTGKMYSDRLRIFRTPRRYNTSQLIRDICDTFMTKRTA